MRILTVVRKLMSPLKSLCFSFILMALLPSCNQSKVEGVGKESNSDSQVEKVGLNELAKNLQRFDGKLVELKGEFSFYFEDVALYDDGLFADDNIRFWLNLTEAVVRNENLLQQLSGKSVIVRGRLNSKGRGHLGRYSAALDSVYYIRQQ